MARGHRLGGTAHDRAEVAHVDQAKWERLTGRAQVIPKWHQFLRERWEPRLDRGLVLPIASAMSAISVQSAHDYLLQHQPEGAAHDDCPLCHPGAGSTAVKAEEVAVADAERTFTEAQHFALLTDAVARETATMSTDKERLETQIAGLCSKFAQRSCGPTAVASGVPRVLPERAF